MSNIDTLLTRNAAFAASDVRHNTPRLPFLPHKGLFVITCIDPRVDPADFLGLEFGEAIVARTVGGRVTPAIIQTSPTSPIWSRPRLPTARTSKPPSSTTPTAAAACSPTRSFATDSPSAPATTSRCWPRFQRSTRRSRSAPMLNAFYRIRVSHRVSQCPATSTMSTPGSSRRSSSHGHRRRQPRPYRDE
jgi:hypothetical protein